MRLRFIYQPVADIDAAAAFYRDTLGLEPDWQEGPNTMAFKLPGSNIAIMLDRDPGEGTTGPFFVVDDVLSFYEENRDRLSFIEPPQRIPPGMYARFRDPSGNIIRVMDDTSSREHG